ncbi:terminase small subunit [Anaerotignum sp.]
MSNHEGLNEKQRRFCEFYAETANAAEAARLAGYSQKNARKIGQRLLTNVDILSYIRQLQDELATPRIAGLLEVKAYWSDTMRNEDLKQKDRLRASELLAKSAGAFLDPREEDFGCHDGGEVHIYMPYTERDEGCDIKREKM